MTYMLLCMLKEGELKPNDKSLKEKREFQRIDRNISRNYIASWGMLSPSHIS